MIAFKSAYELYLQQLRLAFGLVPKAAAPAIELPLNASAPDWHDGQRRPVNRPFRARHEASCFERPPCSYNQHHPYHFD